MNDESEEGSVLIHHSSFISGDWLMQEGQLLLWGEVAVGKTTLLATGLLAYPDRLPDIDWAAEPLEEKEKVLRHWRLLRINQHIEQTTRVTTLELALKNGNKLIVNDIQGRLSRDPLQEESFRRGQQQGFLFVCEWEGADLPKHMAVVEQGLALCQQRKFGIAITKSDRGLLFDDPHWHAPIGWWREHACWKPHARVLERFGERVWPTSAYGFDDDGRCACLLGEFGQVLPYGIRPVNVEAPFRWFFQELGLWQP
jgi:hypothetical protein